MTTPIDGTAPAPWFVTTAIPYVNAQPHVGHALEYVLTDALARYHRLVGDDVWFLTGTDENSLKNVQAAEREGVSPAELVARNSRLFLGLRDPLDLSFDDFIRTSAEARHRAGVWRLWEACDRAGDIYKRAYRGLYCVGCEQFYAESELDGGVCPVHRTVPDEVEEENHFFRLSRYAAALEDHIASGRFRIEPETRRNEVLSFIRGGLADFSISRSQARAHGWGVPVPGDPDQVMYVWFDALGNYITALDYADDGPRFRRYWTEAKARVHVVGKDIIRFHAVYWPAMLLSAGLALPTDLMVHGFLTVEGVKISKSLGNVIDPVGLADAYGSDALRYYLLRQIRSTDDGDFALERFVRACNADLADQLGNLLSRTLGMIGRYYDGAVPAPADDERWSPGDRALRDAGAALGARVDAAMARFQAHEAMAAIWDVVDVANKHVVAVEPWTLAKRRKSTDPAEAADAEARLATTLYGLAETLRLAAWFSQPFIPKSAAGIFAQLGVAADAAGAWPAPARWGGLPAGTRVQPGGVLFPKLELPLDTEA